MNTYAIVRFKNQKKFIVLFKGDVRNTNEFYPLEIVYMDEDYGSTIFWKDGIIKWRWEEGDQHPKPVNGHLDIDELDDDIITMDFNNDKEALLWMKLN